MTMMFYDGVVNGLSGTGRPRVKRSRLVDAAAFGDDDAEENGSDLARDSGSGRCVARPLP